jgi:hypothetical protein
LFIVGEAGVSRNAPRNDHYLTLQEETTLPMKSRFETIPASLFLFILPGWTVLTLLGTSLRADFREKFA